MICSWWNSPSYVLTCPTGGFAPWCYCTKWGSSQGPPFNLFFKLVKYLPFSVHWGLYSVTMAFKFHRKCLGNYTSHLFPLGPWDACCFSFQFLQVVSNLILSCEPRDFIPPFSLLSFRAWGEQEEKLPLKTETKNIHEYLCCVYCYQLCHLWQGECIFLYLTFLTNMTVNSFLTVLCIPKKIQLQLHFNFHNPIPYPHGNDPCIHRRICSPGYMACAFPFHTLVWPECPYWMWRDD